MPRLHSYWNSLLALAVALVCMRAASLSAVTFYVSPEGDDIRSGSREDPLNTISAAADRAMPGDTVYVLDGVYRERVTPRRSGKPGKPIIYRGEPGKRVIVKGSKVWNPQWHPEGEGVFSAKPDDSLFNDHSPEYLDSYNPLKVNLASTPCNRAGRPEKERGYGGDENLAYTCGQVFVDGEPFLEVPFRRELKSGTWHYDHNSNTVFIHFGDKSPAESLVELTTRRRIFAPVKRGLGHIVVEGFIFEHCGNQYPTNWWETDANAQKGAVGTEAGHHWVIRRNVVRYAKTFAIDAGIVDGHSVPSEVHDNVIEENYVIDNGAAGILSNGSENLVIRNNVILRNNRLHFLGPKRWEQAGIKCHEFRRGLIQRNYVACNFDTYGIWLDNQFPDCRLSCNVIHGNGRAGIFLEMTDYEFDSLLIDNNLLIGNRENAVYIHDASGATFIHNLLANTEDTEDYGQAIYIHQATARTKTCHHSFFYNMILGNARNVDVNYPAARSGPQRFDHNLYGIDPTARTFAINRLSDDPAPWTTTEFRNLVQQDVNPENSQLKLMQDGDRMALTSQEWYDFWQRHGIANDVHSKFDPDGEVHYDGKSQTLTLTIHRDPVSADTENASRIERDFFDRERPTTRGNLPGPFIDLRQGKNVYKVWDGLPPVIDDLPPAEWTTCLKSASSVGDLE